MGKNYPGTRISWHRMDACFRLVLHYYFQAKTNSEFESMVVSSKNFTKKEAEIIIKHWKKEIYPVKKSIAEWMWKLGREIDSNFNSNLKKLKKSGFNIIENKQKNVKSTK